MIFCFVGRAKTSSAARLFGTLQKLATANFQDHLVMTASITLHVYFNPLFKNQSLEKGENNRRELSKILSCKSAEIPYKSRVFGV